jgi:hypothetical protein
MAIASKPVAARGAPALVRADQRDVTQFCGCQHGSGSSVQRYSDLLNGSPPVQRLQIMSSALQVRSTGRGVVQRDVSKEEGRKGLRVRIIATGEEGVITGPAPSPTGLTRFTVKLGKRSVWFYFDELDPADARKRKRQSGDGIEGGAAARGAARRQPKRGQGASAKTEDKEPKGDGHFAEGAGVRWRSETGHWHDGLLTKIHRGIYTVSAEGALIKELGGLGSQSLTRDRVRTSAAVRARVAEEGEVSSSGRRTGSVGKLASRDQQHELATGYSAITPLLLRNPLLFGHVLRTGGQISTRQIQEIAKARGIELSLNPTTKGRSRGKPPRQAIVAKDTSALLFTRLDDLKKGGGEWLLHGKSLRPDDASEAQAPPRKRARTAAPECPVLTQTQLEALKKVNLSDFRRKYLFQQGSIAGENLHLTAGPRRTELHAEAKVVNSPAWDHVVRQTIAEFRGQGNERRLPARRKIISIVISRSSCGSREKSGHTGGCAGEVARVISAFWRTLANALGGPYTERLKTSRRIEIQVSVGGKYKKSGKTETIVAAGASVHPHPTYDFLKDSPEPVTPGKYEYGKTLAKARSGLKRSPSLEDLLNSDAALGHERPGRAQPVRQVSARLGQHQAFGIEHPEHSGRIACTSIAAVALQSLLADPQAAFRWKPRDLHRVLREGTDIDHKLRENLRSRNGSEGEPKLDAGEGEPEDGDADIQVSVRYEPVAEKRARDSSTERKPAKGRPAKRRKLKEPPDQGKKAPSAGEAKKAPPANKAKRGRRAKTSNLPADETKAEAPAAPPRKKPSRDKGKEKVETPSKAVERLSSRDKGKEKVETPSETAESEKEASPTPGETKPPSASSDIADRFFAHHEVKGSFPGLKKHKAALKEVGPQYLNGVRGDYRRIARQVASMKVGHGLLVTIGASTIAVANVTQDEAAPRFALFDSHDEAILEIYDSEEALADGIDALYSALPGAHERDAVWYATPYFRRVIPGPQAPAPTDS